jgi:hypothetical protein
MPTATSFNALGRGNGFPFCGSKQDVSSFDKWQTLGGYKDTDTDDVTPSQINQSLVNAVKIYWNLYGLSLFARSLDDNNSVDIEAGSPSSSPTDTQAVVAGLPSTRACGTDVTANPLVYNLPYSDSATLGNYSATVDVDINIVRMYDGVTTDEDNFVGYGISASSNNPAIQCEAEHSAGAVGDMGSRLFVSSYINDISGGFDNSKLTDYVNISYGSGVSIPMVTAMAVGANAIIAYASLSTNPPRAYIFNDVNDLYAMETKLNSLEFYTYS